MDEAPAAASTPTWGPRSAAPAWCVTNLTGQPGMWRCPTALRRPNGLPATITFTGPALTARHAAGPGQGVPGRHRVRRETPGIIMRTTRKERSC
ncbi:MAG: hypothetical protein WKG07_24980 [Hymenobacter sp.]